jgi:hypothetical protein
MSLRDQWVRDRTCPEQVGNHAKVRPRGVRQQHLVAWFEQGAEHQVERLDASLRDHYLIRECLVAVASGYLVRQGFAQLGEPCVRGVAGMSRPRGLVSGLDDMFGRRKVRFAYLEMNGLRIFPSQLHDLADARDGHRASDRRGRRESFAEVGSGLVGAQ